MKEIVSKEAIEKLEKEAEMLVPGLLREYNNHVFLRQGIALRALKDKSGFWCVKRKTADSFLVIRHHLSARSVCMFLQEMSASIRKMGAVIDRLAGNVYTKPTEEEEYDN